MKEIIEDENELNKFRHNTRMRLIKERHDEGRLTQRDLQYILDHMGKFNFNGSDIDPNIDDFDDNDTALMDAYAENIYNYIYNYTPEATIYDSNVDPNEEHIGPMAQDIEQVNPACVETTPDGVKKVNTDRLALMNAGVIGDIVRRLDALESKLNLLIGD